MSITATELAPVTAMNPVEPSRVKPMFVAFWPTMSRAISLYDSASNTDANVSPELLTTDSLPSGVHELVTGPLPVGSVASVDRSSALSTTFVSALPVWTHTSLPSCETRSMYGCEPAGNDTVFSNSQVRASYIDTV